MYFSFYCNGYLISIYHGMIFVNGGITKMMYISIFVNLIEINVCVSLLGPCEDQ